METSRVIVKRGKGIIPKRRFDPTKAQFSGQGRKTKDDDDDAFICRSSLSLLQTTTYKHYYSRSYT